MLLNFQKWFYYLLSSNSNFFPIHFLTMNQQRLLFTLLLYLIPQTQAHKPNSNPVKLLLSSSTLKMSQFKPGVASEVLEDAIFYTKYIPVIFQLKVPEWTVEKLNLNASLHCLSDEDDAKKNHLCPVAYHLRRLLASFADSMRFTKNMFTPGEGARKKSEQAGWLYFGKIDCYFIDSHFAHLSTHTEDLHQYVDKLKETCPLAKDIQPIVSTRGDLLLPDEIIDSYKVFSGYNATEGVGMAGFSAFQTAYLLLKYIDTVRWNYAYTQCLLNSKLSVGLVDTFMLRRALSVVQKIADKNGYKLSIPFVDNPKKVDMPIPLYYELPLTDCIMGIQTTKNTQMMLRLLVPVQKKYSKYTRYRLSKIPYLIMEGGTKKICEVDSFDPKDDFLVENNLAVHGSSPHITLSPDCVPGQLCHLSEHPRPLVVDHCVAGLLNGSIEHIRNFCSFECFQVEHEEQMLPIIIQLTPNQYSITGSNKKHNVSVFCNEKLYQVLNPNENNGVMQVTLPCNCDIHYKSEMYKSGGPTCQESPTLETYYLSSSPIYSPPPPPPPPVEIPRDEKTTTRNPLPESNSSSRPLKEASEPLPLNADEEDASDDGEEEDFTIIWLLILLLLFINGFLFYVVYENRLIDLGVVRETLGRLGVGTSTPPRSRLQEEVTGHSSTPPQPRRGSNSQSINIQYMSENDSWPAHLNRL